MDLHEKLCETPAMANMAVKTVSHMFALARKWAHGVRGLRSVPVHPVESQP